MKRYALLLLPLFLVACTAPQTDAPVAPTVAQVSPVVSLEPRDLPQMTPTLTYDEPTDSPPTPTDEPTTIPAATSSGNSYPYPTLAPRPTLEVPFLDVGKPITLTSLYMMDEKTGWAIADGGLLDGCISGMAYDPEWRPDMPSGHIVRTTDGGNAWQDVHPPDGAYEDSCFFALDANTAWAVHHNNDVAFIWHTIDGGKSWQKAERQLQPLMSIVRALYFVDDQTGWYMGDSGIGEGARYSTYFFGTTTDGGKTWSERGGEVDQNLYIDLVFLDKQVGFKGLYMALDLGLFAGSGEIFENLYDGLTVSNPPIKTTDGGKTWSRVEFPKSAPVPPKYRTPELAEATTNCSIADFERLSSQGVGVKVVCGYYVWYEKTLFRGSFFYDYISSDSGQTWHNFAATGNEHFVNEATGWRLSVDDEGQPGQLQKTTDSGYTWTTLKTVTWQSAKFDFITEQVGWAIVTNNGISALVRTNDGGQTWVELQSMAVE